ncbi:MAG TPA: hypothetical protein VML94_04180 [Thermoplasmata archaeon]|nr:hypothetical protein [Thermoplasmata archaeon]
MSGAPPPRPPSPSRGGLFPIPLVGTAAILLVLIVFTPILFATGPPAAGSFETQGELAVDQYPVGSNTTFYLHAVGPTVRYAVLSIGLASGFPWTGVCPTSGLAFSVWENFTDRLDAVVGTAANPVAVSATATYTAGGATANYSAELAFDFSGSTVSVAVCYGATPPAASQPIASLPLLLLLQNWGSGGPP